MSIWFRISYVCVKTACCPIFVAPIAIIGKRQCELRGGLRQRQHGAYKQPQSQTHGRGLSDLVGPSRRGLHRRFCPLQRRDRRTRQEQCLRGRPYFRCPPAPADDYAARSSEARGRSCGSLFDWLVFSTCSEARQLSARSEAQKMPSTCVSPLSRARIARRRARSSP